MSRFKQKAQPKEMSSFEEEWEEIRQRAVTQGRAYELSDGTLTFPPDGPCCTARVVDGEYGPELVYIAPALLYRQLDTNPEHALKQERVRRMVQAGLQYSEFYMAPVAQLAEECGIRFNPKLISEDYR